MKARHFLFFLLAAFLLSAFGCAAPHPDMPSSSPTAEPPSLPPVSVPSETQETDIPVTDPAQDPQQTRTLEILDSMTLEEKVGQLFFARLPDSGAAEDAAKYHLGGFILFGKDFDGRTPDTIRENISVLQSAAKIPLLIGVDEEGGTVCRVSSHSAFRAERFPSPRTLYAQGGIDALIQDAAEKANLLTGLGINVNLAPVCDITTEEGAILYDRSLGLAPELTASCITEIVRTMQSGGLAAVLKHFPGYGNNSDTHTGPASDTRTLDELVEKDLIPFAAGIKAGAGCVMVSHNTVICLDNSRPASLSPAVHRILRTDLAFDGVIMTDDLSMGAITESADPGEAAILAIEAGNDLLCSSNYTVQLPAVLQAVKDGRLSEEQIDTSVLRILLWKIHLGMLS